MRRPGTQAVLSWLIVKYIHLVWITGRWTITGADIPRTLNATDAPYIIAFWHGRMLMIPQALGGERHNVSVLSSTHRDGRISSGTMRYFEIATIDGSTSKGGASAVRNSKKFLESGGILGITPDGPRGPRMRASIGVIAIARMAGVPIVPVAFSASRRIVLGSWDRFVLPLPFTRGAFVWGAPVRVAKGGDREAARHAVEQALNAVTEQADALVGQPAIAPAPETGDKGATAAATER